jgi:D-alanyl-D-alanine carboxypeptidase/D-alanyl-D-alanine-endopeptidase (penicillin-binding protein 4)
VLAASGRTARAPADASQLISRRASAQSAPVLAARRFLLATLLMVSLRTSAVAGDDLAARLTTALAHPGLRGAKVGALVVCADDGRVLFDHGADQLLVPASNLKILTALAALATFGPTHRFTTRIYADTALSADGAVGTLAVRGGGDPALTSEEWWRLAADLRRAGLRKVRDGLILDDTYFDHERWNSAWDAVSARAFHAPVGALNANYGAFSVEVQARPGGAPRIGIDPPLSVFEVVDHTRPGSGALTVDRQSAGARERIIVGGAAPTSGEAVTVFRSVADPVVYAGAVLRMQLAAHGIVVGGQDRNAAVPAGDVELLAFTGKPLADILRLLMKYSNNNIAETLLKDLAATRMGPPGTWANGVAAIRERVTALGVPAGGFQTVDGSGLSPANRVTPRALVEALRIARASFEFGPEFESALPIAARDGTLSSRATAAGDAVRAKTGLLTGAAALSGYARARDGTVLIFSLLVNDYTRGDPDALAGIDGFATALTQ